MQPRSTSSAPKKADSSGRPVTDPASGGSPSDRYAILGVEVGLRTDSPEVRAFFSHAYRWFPASGCAADLDLSAFFGASAPGAPFVAAGGHRIDLSDSPSRENQAFLFLLEALMDRIEGSIVLHGAAVSHRKSGVILAGPALAGKSTLVLELMKLGHGFLSDDAAPLERGKGRLLPFPRAIGIRKESPDERPDTRGLPSRGVLALPHKWLVDPEAFGARLPAEPCVPRYLFYLEPESGVSREPSARTFEIALADGGSTIGEDLSALAPESVEVLQGRTFPTLLARFGAGARPVSALAALARRHRRSILYMEEMRPAAVRADGDAVIREVGPASLLLPLVRDVLNRGEGGRLMASHSGKLTSLVVELGTLLEEVRCFRVASGTPRRTAAAITEIVEGSGGLR